MTMINQTVQNALREFIGGMNEMRQETLDMGDKLSAEVMAEVKNPEVFLQGIIGTLRKFQQLAIKLSTEIYALVPDMDDANEISNVTEWNDALKARLDADLVASCDDYLKFKLETETELKAKLGLDTDPLIDYLTKTEKLEYFFELISAAQ